MADQCEKLSAKRQHERCDSEPETKRQKLSDNEGEAAAAADNTDDTETNSPLTGICSELLLTVFSFLDLESLLNVAHTCKRFQTAAATKFNDGYSKKRICFYAGFNRDANSIKKRYLQFDDEIRIFDNKFALPFLRCFGSKIVDLSINDRDESEHICRHMDRYINQYCAPTLTSISFVYFHRLFNVLFENPFENVAKVRISMSNLETVLPKFLHWFPRLRHLELLDFTIKVDFTAVSFPYLEYLHINPKYLEYQDSVPNLLHANQKLQTIFVYVSDESLTKLLDMIIGNTLLTKLQIWKGHTGSFHVTIKNVMASELLRLAKEHPNIVALDLQAFLCFADDAICFIDQMPASMKFFKFRVNSRLEYESVVYRLKKKWRHFKYMDALVTDHYIITLMRLKSN